jgi:uncharacterized membrane protein YsdA (DUF1294 family)
MTAERAFVHIKAFQSRSRRPVDGDLISYSTSKDGRGRLNATEIRFAGQKIETPKPRAPGRPSKPRVRVALAAVFLLVSWIGTLSGFLPAVIPFAYSVMSCVSYIAYALDKIAAGKGRQRIPESLLHLLDVIGGWPGALIAQQQYRHKTVKVPFQSVFWFTVLANIAAVILLARSGMADVLTTSLLGG